MYLVLFGSCSHVLLCYEEVLSCVFPIAGTLVSRSLLSLLLQAHSHDDRRRGAMIASSCYYVYVVYIYSHPNKYIKNQNILFLILIFQVLYTIIVLLIVVYFKIVEVL